jgi:hypothetical protein
VGKRSPCSHGDRWACINGHHHRHNCCAELVHVDFGLPIHGVVLYGSWSMCEPIARRMCVLSTLPLLAVITARHTLNLSRNDPLMSQDLSSFTSSKKKQVYTMAYPRSCLATCSRFSCYILHDIPFL